MKKTITINFVVNGENARVEVNEDARLVSAVERALQLTHNTGRPPQDWEVRDEKGTLLDVNRQIEAYHFHEGVKLFVSLGVGAGGNKALLS